MKECDRIDNCGFIKKYINEKGCKGFVKMYCLGDKQDKCKRKEYFMTNGSAPSDDMLPTGQMKVAKI